MPVAGQFPTRIHLMDSESVHWEKVGAPYPDPNDPNFLVQDVKAHALKFSPVTTGASDSTFTLDPIASWLAPEWLIVKADSGAGKVKVTPHAGDPNILGATEYDLPNQFDFVRLFTDGTSIYVAGSSAGG